MECDFLISLSCSVGLWRARAACFLLWCQHLHSSGSCWKCSGFRISQRRMRGEDLLFKKFYFCTLSWRMEPKWDDESRNQLLILGPFWYSFFHIPLQIYLPFTPYSKRPRFLSLFKNHTKGFWVLFVNMPQPQSSIKTCFVGYSSYLYEHMTIGTFLF